MFPGRLGQYDGTIWKLCVVASWFPDVSAYFPTLSKMLSGFERHALLIHTHWKKWKYVGVLSAHCSLSPRKFLFETALKPRVKPSK